jgi:hypothetical protein
MLALRGASGRPLARNGCRVLSVRTLSSGLSLLVAVMLAFGSVRGSADALDGVLEVRSAYVDVDHSVFQLHARIEYPMNPQILDALRDGVTLAFDLDTRVVRERRLWFDATIVELTFHRELAYHTVTDRYVVREDRTGDQQSFPTLDDALRFLGTIDNVPILVEAQLASGERYRVSVRAGVRRGRLPASLRALLFWTDDWHRVSPWYTWSLPS